MAMNRARVAFTGVAGLPGVATFYFGSSTTDMTALRTFWDAVKANFPNTMQIQVPNSGDTINETTGVITGAWSGPSQTVVVGTGGVGAYLSTAGAMVRWNTPQVVDGRRPIGKTYLVPCMNGVFDSAGTIANASITTYQTAASALITAYAGEMKIYHRHNAKGPGVACTITSASVPDKQVVLRSRRD